MLIMDNASFHHSDRIKTRWRVYSEITNKTDSRSPILYLLIAPKIRVKLKIRIYIATVMQMRFVSDAITRMLLWPRRGRKIIESNWKIAVLNG